MIKRAFDVCCSFLLILILTVIPVLIVVPILIVVTSEGPAVFKQERLGKNQRPFMIYKFRTMKPIKDSVGNDGKLQNPKDRITKIGRILRKTSLDELMQLFNILNGTMSFVGPRPILPYQISHYTEDQKRRFEMRPGVTGWAQVNGRNNLSWTEKIQFDTYYVDHFSLGLDIKILFKTVLTVLKHKDIEYTQDDKINVHDEAFDAYMKKVLEENGVNQKTDQKKDTD